MVHFMSTNVTKYNENKALEHELAESVNNNSHDPMLFLRPLFCSYCETFCAFK